jgi:DNA-binding GntR family transcriptional regulator
MDSAMRGTPGIIADRIREDISTGAIAGGTTLNQVQLAERFGVSRIPIREALRALEADGLIRYVPNRGATVTSFTLDDVRERYEMRLALEPLALALAIPRLTDEHVRRAKYELDEMRAEATSKDWGKHHLAFHWALYQAADRPRLLATIGSLYLNMAQTVGTLTREDARAHLAEHRAILAACKEGDAAAAVRALKGHLAESLERVLAVIEPASPNHQRPRGARGSRSGR